MNTVLLNTVHLDGAPIVKKGSGEGGGSTILNQSKSVEITENGSVSVTPDAGYTGLSKVDVNVDVPTQEINNQDKAIDIVENGTTEIVADSGYTGLGKVSVNVNVASSGGDLESKMVNDVTFYDYDGVVLHSYTKEEFLALSEMPPLPTRKGLICQEWNWNYEDAIAYVREYGILNIGATYITDDGKTRLYISVTKGRQDVPLAISQSVANGVTIDWGDGSATETLIDRSGVVSHGYADNGFYCITLEVAEGCEMSLGERIIGGYTHYAYDNVLRKVEIGERVVRIGNLSAQSLTSISMPVGIKEIKNSFSDCRSIVHITIPRSVTSVGNQAFRYCSSLSCVAFPNLPVTRDFLFEECYALSSFAYPNGSTAELSFQKCYSLRRAVIPNSITTLDGRAFSECESLEFLVIPGSVSELNNYMFSNCRAVSYYDFSQHQTVPSLTSSSVFYYIPSDCKIIVPDILYDEWIVATNWSSLASQIIKKSDWDASQS